MGEPGVPEGEEQFELDLGGSLERALAKVPDGQPFTIERLAADRTREDGERIFLSVSYDRYRDEEGELRDVVRISEWPAIPPKPPHPGTEWSVAEYEGGVLKEPRITVDLLEEVNGGPGGERHLVHSFPRLLNTGEIRAILEGIDTVLATGSSGAHEAIEVARQQ